MTTRQIVIGLLALVAALFVFVVPFVFVAINASKTVEEAAHLSFALPERWMFFENLVAVVQARDYALLLAYWNSIVITVGAITLLVIFGAMVDNFLFCNFCKCMSLNF